MSVVNQTLQTEYVTTVKAFTIRYASVLCVLSANLPSPPPPHPQPAPSRKKKHSVDGDETLHKMKRKTHCLQREVR